MHGVRSTNYILQEADLLLYSVRVLMTGRLAKQSSSVRCQNYSCRYRPRRAGQNQATDVAIQADVDDVLAQLIPLVERNRVQSGTSWWRICSVNSRVNPESVRSIKPLRPDQRRCRRVDDNAIITTDVGQHQMWTAKPIRSIAHASG